MHCNINHIKNAITWNQKNLFTTFTRISHPPKHSTKRQPRKSLRNTNHINIKEINYHHNQIIIIILSYEKIYITPTNTIKIRAHHTSRIIKESLTLIPKKHKQKRNRINKSQFYDINNPHITRIIYP